MNNNKPSSEELKSKEDCVHYHYAWYYVFIPPLNIFNTLCYSTDKTYMFLASFVRCLLIGLIIKLYYDNVELDGNLYNGFVWLVTYGIINLIIIVIVMLKQQKYQKGFSSDDN